MFVGIDIGSLVTKAVLINSNRLIAYFITDSRTGPIKAGETALKQVIEKADCRRENIKSIVVTGYGRISFSSAHKTVTELTCHGKGAHFLNPNVRTIIDIGGQDSKVIRIDKNGILTDFEMNDKCAAGTGRFLEVMADALGKNIEEMGDYSLKSHSPCSLTSTCTVFAESEVVSLSAKGVKKEDIAAGLHLSIAKRVGNMVKRLGSKSEYMFVGGVAKNVGIRKSLEEFLTIRFAEPNVDPQIVGALGAALIAKDLAG